MANKKISELPDATIPLSGTELMEVVQGGTSKKVAKSDVGGGLPYKVYTALLTQSGTDDPVAIVLENTLGGVVVWTRQAAGYYWGVLNGTFPRNKTICIGNSYSGTVNIVNDEINEPSDRILLKSKDYTGAETDGLFYLSTIEIRVYPA